jgi:ESX secretion system protein EccD
MLDGRSRVTVVGGQRRVDVALPSAAPIGEYTAGLAKMCGQDSHRALPPAWSLAVAGAKPLPLSASLADSGVVDGQVLYLHDVARDPGAEMTVEDVPELIAGEAETQRQGWPRALVAMTFGLAWLAAAAGFAFAVRRPGSGPITPAVSFVVAGLLLLAIGWALAQRRVIASATLCVLTSLAAVPCLAVSGALLGQALAGRPFLWVGAVGGATAGVLMSLAATPEAVVLLVGLQFAVALLVAPLLVVVHATGTQVAAAAVVAAVSVLGLAKLAAAHVTVWSHHKPSGGTGAANVATSLLIRSRFLLTVLVAGPVLTLAVALPVLAFSRSWFALAMAGVAGVALMVRAQQAGFAEELVPVGGAGLVGLFAVLAALAGRTGVPVTVVLTVAGLALVVGGAMAAILHGGAEPGRDMPPGFPADAGRRDRRKFLDIFGMLCMIATVPLALGVFGVFHDLMGMGRGMVG